VRLFLGDQSVVIVGPMAFHSSFDDDQLI